MLGPIDTGAAAIIGYGNQMAGVADRMSKAFQEDSDVDVAKEMATSAILKAGIEANTKLIRVQDEMTASILDIVA
jgi:flagellar hook protein FlgE